jgi:hypothetical protein
MHTRVFFVNPPAMIRRKQASVVVETFVKISGQHCSTMTATQERCLHIHATLRNLRRLLDIILGLAKTIVLQHTVL